MLKIKPERKNVNSKLWSYSDELLKLDLEINIKDNLIRDLRTASVTSDEADRLKDKYSKDILKCVREKSKILEAFNKYISPLSIELRAIFYARYIEKYPVSYIARKTNYSNEHIKRLIARGQDKISGTP